MTLMASGNAIPLPLRVQEDCAGPHPRRTHPDIPTVYARKRGMTAPFRGRFMEAISLLARGGTEPGVVATWPGGQSKDCLSRQLQVSPLGWCLWRRSALVSSHERKSRRTALQHAEPSWLMANRQCETAFEPWSARASACRSWARPTSALALESQVRLQRPDLVIVAWNLVVAHAESVLAALRSSSGSLRIVVLGLRPETSPDRTGGRRRRLHQHGGRARRGRARPAASIRTKTLRRTRPGGLS